jgi:hypothetical protein
MCLSVLQLQLPQQQREGDAKLASSAEAETLKWRRADVMALSPTSTFRTVTFNGFSFVPSFCCSTVQAGSIEALLYLC